MPLFARVFGAALVLVAAVTAALAGFEAAAARVRVALGFSAVVLVDDTAAVATIAAALAGDSGLAVDKPPLGLRGDIGCDR